MRIKGLALARQFFEEHRSVIAGFEDVAAVGLFGPGSECFGFDDEISRDHDFSAGFFVLIPQSEDVRAGVSLARAYHALPDEFMGVSLHKKSAFGFPRGVMTIEGFFRSVTGFACGPQSMLDWLRTPSWALAEAVNGAVFFDGPGIVTDIRSRIASGMPEDVRKKKLAARAAGMAQSGQYNYMRCLKHGEKGAAALALFEFAKQAAETVYLLNKKHMPFYKWCFRGMKDLAVLSELREAIEAVLQGSAKQEDIESICAAVAEEFRAQGLSRAAGSYLEPHAFEIMRGIEDQELAAMHVMDDGGAF